jgi:hypothetical protein
MLFFDLPDLYPNYFQTVTLHKLPKTLFLGCLMPGFKNELPEMSGKDMELWHNRYCI